MLAILLGGFRLPARSQLQTKSGTTVVIDVTQDKVTIAADSRINFPDGRYRDDDCKISAFDNKIVFASSGQRHMQAAFRNGQPTIVWDSHDVAIQAFKAVMAKPTRPRDDIAVAVARQWEILTRDFFLSFMRIDPQPVLGLASHGTDTIVEGVFVGKHRNGHLTAVQVGVAVDRSLPTIKASSQVIAPGRIGMMGFKSVALEFYWGNSPRAKAEINRWKNTLVGNDAANRRVAFITQLVKWSVLSEPRDVGGEVDTVVFDSNGVHWIHRKKNCKASE